MRQVGIWAASSPSTKEQLHLGLEKVKSLGLLPVIPALTKKFATRGLSKVQPFLAGPNSVKITALLKLWRDPKISDIFCIRGGYGALHLLPLLDKALPNNSHKRVRKFWGYSDSTIVQLYLYKRFGFPWVHSPMITGTPFQKPTPREAVAWNRVFSKERSLEFSLNLLNPSQKFHVPKRALFIGGNLSSLVSMMGSPWEPSSKKSFYLFIEDIHEDGRRLDRLLTQLANSTFFLQCAAVVCGHFTQCTKHHAVIKLWAKHLGIPVLNGFPAGHESPNLPFMMGVNAELTIQRRKALIQVPNPHFEC